MSARERIEALLAASQGESQDYIDGIRDALHAVISGNRESTPEQRQKKTARVLRRRKRLNDELIERSFSRRRHYSYAEWLVVMDRSLSTQDVARKLGRTYKGVMHARSKLNRGYIPFSEEKS